MKKEEKKSEERVVDAVIPNTEITAENSETVETVLEACKNENLQRMINIFNLDFQNPSRVLTSHDPSERFRVRQRSIESLPINDLKDVHGIDDFTDASEAVMPIVTRTPDGLFIMDGKDRIESAKAAGEASIFCEVDTITSHSMTEVLLRKAGIRSQTRGGRARFAELARNAAKLEQRMMAENSDLRSFAHGGRRTGESFMGDRTNDVRTVLTERLSKSRNTINSYISYARYVSDTAMTYLIEGNQDKAFFEKFGKIKSKIVEKLQEEHKTLDEITTVVSAAILRCATDGFPETVKPRPNAQVVPSAPQQPEYEHEDEVAQGEYAAEDDVSDEYETDENTFDELIPIASDSAENPDPVEAIKNSSLEVSSRLAQRIETSKDATDLYIVLIEEIQALNSIASKIVKMANPDLKTVQQAA